MFGGNQSKQEEYSAEEIIDMRGTAKRREFLVRWRGYDVSESTWESTAALENEQDLIQKFLAQRSKKEEEAKEKRGETPPDQESRSKSKSKKGKKKSSSNEQKSSKKLPSQPSVSTPKSKSVRRAFLKPKPNPEEPRKEDKGTSKTSKRDTSSAPKKVSISLKVPSDEIVTDPKKIQELNLAKATKVLGHLRMSNQSYVKLAWKDATAKLAGKIVPASALEKQNPSLMLKYLKEHLKFHNE